MTLGLVCDACSAFNALGATTCTACGDPLGITKAAPAATAPAATAPDRTCPSCNASVPAAHKFCGSCGKPMPDLAETRPTGKERQAPKTMFFSVMQAPGRAKLILIKGDGYDGVSYVLSATEHVARVARRARCVFPDDTLLSPRHANFLYQVKTATCSCETKSSTNGVFVRIVKPQRRPHGLDCSSSESSCCASMHAPPRRCTDA